ncbi:MAG TPA: hypothetical protein VNW50_11510 [Streptosporangiaceae bacterium]|nr:hypothetical protein [Streptosporangiaceae bacterium]
MLAGDVPGAVPSALEARRAAAPLTVTLAAGATREAGSALTVGQAMAISAAPMARAAAGRAPCRSRRRDIRRDLRASPGVQG